MSSRWFLALALACAGCGAPRPDAKVPPARAAASPVGKGLSPGDVSSAVKRANSKFQGCLFLASSPDSTGSIEIDWTIAESGDVTEAHVGASSFPDQGVVECVRRQMQRLQFPAATADTAAVWKFTFRHPKRH